MACISCSVAMYCAHVQYPKSVSFIEFLMDFCICGDIADTYTIQITDKKLLHSKLSESGQILHVDKTSFPRPGHNNYSYTIYS